MIRNTEVNLSDLKDMCCGSGCTPCILDVYDSFKNCKSSQQYESTNIMSTIQYTKFKLISSKSLSSTFKQLKFDLSDSHSDDKLRWNPGQHFLIQITGKDDKKTSRPYTPLQDEELIYDESGGAQYFCIIVKKISNGLGSSFLWNLELGEETLWRGPYGQYVLPLDYKNVVLIAQGVGCAPFYSIIQAILNDEDNSTVLKLFCCYQNLSDVIFRKTLINWNRYWNFRYFLFVKSLDDTLYYKEPVYEIRLKLDNVISFIDISLDQISQFAICGSNDFMGHFKKELIKKEVDPNKIVLF